MRGGGNVAARTFDLASYDQLLIAIHPRVPRTEKENERLISLLKKLDDKEQTTPEEDELVKLLVVLIEDFEETHYATRKAQPFEVLRELMRVHDVKPKDLYETFGSKGTTSEVLRGKRAISKGAAKKLAKRFHASVEMFL
jgi:HTH-type transcriptional regulator/antitoxin HigA